MNYDSTIVDVTKDHIDNTIQMCREICAEWDGKEPGRLEDAAYCAREVIGASFRLRNLLIQLEGFSL